MPNKDYDFNSKKYMFLLITICLLFFVIVIKAFDYLPEKYGTEYAENKGIQETVVLEEKTDNKNVEPQETDIVETENTVVKVEKNTSNEQKVDELEIIESNINENNVTVESMPTAELSQDEKALKHLYSANSLKEDKKYSEALSEYQKIPEETDSKDIVASSYEGISRIYAQNRRLGTALSFAVKAYNLSPTSSLALLVAQLYNKTGNTQKATQIMNRLLTEEIK